MAPLLSIVTPALNGAEFLPRNVASVRAQGLPPDQLEHWVIDGGSTDGTVGWLRQQPDLKFISEPDRGLSDAVNKGIERAAGQWILWLNADDELAPGALAAFQAALRQYPEARLFCGAEKIFRYDGTLERIEPGWDYNLKDLLGTRTSISQAATFVHRSVYERVGLLEVGCRDAMDYEWTVRAAHQFRCQPLAAVLAHYHRRPGSIMDAHLAAFYRTFLRLRRQYHQSYFSAGELRIRWYLWTEPLRRVRWLRRCVRGVKGCFGRAPLHPMS